MSEIEIDFKMPPLGQIAKKVLPQVGPLIAATMQTNRAMLFASSGSHNGHPAWAPLKLRKGQPLKDRGTLSQSMGPKNAGSKPGMSVGSIVRISSGLVIIGTSLAYAPMQNYGTAGLPGGVLKPVRAKALRFQGYTKSGKKAQKFIFAKYVKIPARPFDQINTADKAEIAETVSNFIVDGLNRG